MIFIQRAVCFLPWQAWPCHVFLSSPKYSLHFKTVTIYFVFIVNSLHTNVLLKTLQILVLWSMKYYLDKIFISNGASLQKQAKTLISS